MHRKAPQNKDSLSERLSLCNSMNYTVHEILQARILEWVAFPFSRGIFPTQGSNPCLPHCRKILYQLSHKGNPRILERVAYPFSSRSSQPRNRTGVSCTAGGFFTNWAILTPNDNSVKIVLLDQLTAGTHILNASMASSGDKEGQ